MVVSSRRMVRSAGVMLACATSAFAGLALIFKLVTPESVGELGTPHLLGLVGLLVLPVLVVVMHRRSAAELADAGELIAEPMVENIHEPTTMSSPRDIVVLAPDLRDRTARRHRRRGVAAARAKA